MLNVDTCILKARLATFLQTGSIERRTSLPLCTHLRHGRLLSHLRCFFLQFTHAEATCAFGFRVARGDIGLNAYRGSERPMEEDSALDVAWYEVGCAG